VAGHVGKKEGREEESKDGRTRRRGDTREGGRRDGRNGISRKEGRREGGKCTEDYMKGVTVVAAHTPSNMYL
jgi:hypothetical protein